MRLFVFASCLAALVPGVAKAQPDEAPSAQDAAPPADEACFPACRQGYLCHSGACVEACNPPCGEGTTCSARGMCEADAGRSSGFASGPGDPGYAVGAAVTGIVMAALSIGLYAVVAGGQIANGWVDVGLLWGGVGLPFITAPIVGGGALSASGPGVTGLLPLRVGAWIAYGGYFIAALGASIYAADHLGDIPDELAVTLAIVGVATELAFVIDALHTASQASSAAAAPTASLVTSQSGVDGAVVGAIGVF